MMGKRLIVLGVALVLLSGCAATLNEQALKSQMQIRAYQTKSWKTIDTDMVIKAVLNTLQDDGFSVKNAVPQVGLLVAEKSATIDSTGQKVMNIILFGAFAVLMPVPSADVIECTANVSLKGSETTVRVNFVNKILNDNGGLESIKQIEEEKFYQDFFAKVDKGVFLQKEGL